nr:cobaltochelatase subunit CobN [Algiphilus aromaticivorans]
MKNMTFNLSNLRNLRFPLRLLLALLFAPCAAQAATIAGIVSERSAAEMAAGAELFVEQHPEHEVRLRTPEQLAGMSDAEVAALWREADAVVMAAVFGDQVGRIQRLFREAPPGRDVPVLATNSDRDITRLSRLDGERLLAGFSGADIDALTQNPEAGADPLVHLRAQQEAFPEHAAWLEGRAFYRGRSPEHIEGLMRWLLARAGHDIAVPEVTPRPLLRYYRDGRAHADAADLDLADGPAVALLDLDSGDRPGDRELLDAACDALETRGLQCFGVLARWGGASVEAVETLAERAAPAALSAVVSLQDFTVGGGEGRRAVTKALKALDVPVIKGMRLADRSEAEWRLSAQGVPADAVHYKLAMPELQGMIAPIVLAVARPSETDPVTGVRLRLTRPVAERVDMMAERLQRWQRLRTRDNADKRVALVYYNHPPGRQNIGADKLNVPESLLEILRALQVAGYDTGELPKDGDALLSMIQDRGVYLPEHRDALAELDGRVPAMPVDAYQLYFETLPDSVRAELEHGPIGFLHARMVEAVEAEAPAIGKRVLARGVADLRHLLEELEHPARDRALDLLDQLERGWEARLREEASEADLAKLRDALIRTGIPGLSGWGEAPGEAMVHDGALHFPGLRFGNIFIGPQPPRGWELKEELLHANTSFPPTHHYVAFYRWLREDFEADALVYLGRHSTREFLPRRGAGLAADDYPDILGGALPVLYPYIVDGVGEGIQAKRRAMGVMISHLTPPLAATELYDQLLELRQLVETFEAAVDPDSPTRQRAVERLRSRVEELNLARELEREIAAEHGGEGDGNAEHAPSVSLNDVDDELLVHEVGHYVTEMQERHMPLGLHVFGRDWDEEALETMLTSMAGDDGEAKPAWREKLVASPGEEMAHLLAGLEGRYVPPGQGNDPLRTPEVLPTGRNFHALSSDLVPTRVAWSLGSELAAEARARGDAEAKGSEAIVLWASDTVRDEGVMVAFGLDMLGVKPVWNARGIVTDLQRLPLTDGRRRRDALFTTSGLFRDLYEDQLALLDRAVRVALAGSAGTIRSKHPQLAGALDAALESLPDDLREAGDEPLAANDVAASWVADTKALMGEGRGAEAAGRDAALRVFGTTPGAYGAGVNRLADRSGAWDARGELADAYIRRMGHAYGGGRDGTAAHDAFEQRLRQVGRSYLGRASHVYGLLDNDDGFDFQGGLSMAVESLSGKAPANNVLQYADPDNARVESTERALLGELRSRNLNPQWLEPLMAQGYAGARTMAADFIDNLWGWQVTSPEIVRSWVWDEVHQVYLEDRHDIGLDDFLAEGDKVHVKTHLQAILLVAAQRGFWEAEAAVVDALAADFAELVAEHGLPGSGHTAPDHPTMDWVAERLDDQALREAFNAVRDAARRPEQPRATDPASVAEIRVDQKADEAADAQRKQPEEQRRASEDAEAEAAAEGAVRLLPWLIAGVVLILLLGGVRAGRRG